MHFPVWIDKNNKTPLARAQCRLKHMLCQVGLNLYGVTSLRGLASKIGVDHSTLFNSIKRGYFTSVTAEQIEAAVGRQNLRAEYLCRPLEIKSAETTTA